jgi:uncharacterized protein (TIGR00730 family)
MQSICVFCGANKGNQPFYEELTVELGKEIVERGWEAVYGAGNVGLMGSLANSVLAEGGKITGVIPDFLKKMEVCHMGLTELIVVDTMHHRKQIMAERSDAFFILPGGFGTLDEFFEILTWKQLRLHQKPIGLLNTNGYYDYLLQHIDKMVEEGFLHPKNRSLLIEDTSLTGLLDQLAAYKTEAVADKWLRKT